MSDPILEALARIEAKTDETLKNQTEMKTEIAQIHKDTRKAAVIAGSASGAITGGLVSAAIMTVRAKLGF